MHTSGKWPWKNSTSNTGITNNGTNNVDKATGYRLGNERVAMSESLTSQGYTLSSAFRLQFPTSPWDGSKGKEPKHNPFYCNSSPKSRVPSGFTTACRVVARERRFVGIHKAFCAVHQ